MRYDLCLPWYWEYDEEFVRLVEGACLQHNLSFWPITPPTLLDAITDLWIGNKSFRTLLFRGGGDKRFDLIQRWARENNAFRINPQEVSKWSEDKATMHLELIHAGLHTPYTILLPPFLEQPLLPPIDLSPLGGQYVIKPSNQGGGQGVILGASTMDQVLRARMQFPE